MGEGSFTRISTNMVALCAHNALRSIQRRTGISRLRLATGKRINQAADDPAGLSIATKFQYRASGLGVSLDNIGDARNMMAVAEGGLKKIEEILIRMRDKAEQAASDTLGDDERAAIQGQLNGWAEEIGQIAGSTQWNGKRLLDGLSDFDSSTLTLQVGPDADNTSQITLVGGSSGSFGAVDGASLGIASEVGSGSATLASAVVVSDPDGIVVGDLLNTPGPGNRKDIPQLATGRYTLQVHRQKNKPKDSYTIQLLRGSKPVTVDPDGDPVNTPTDKPDTKIPGNAQAQRFIDFGSDLSLTVLVPDVTGNYQAVIDFAAASSGSGGGPATIYTGDLSTTAGARAAMSGLDGAIEIVSSRLQTLGSLAERLNAREEMVVASKTNTEAAHSRIMDADLASEQLELTRQQILQQVSTAVLAQANTTPRGLLDL